MIATFAWLFAMATILAIVRMMWVFDCLVRWEHEHLPERWEQDGKPNGFFWHPKERKFWQGDSSKQHLCLIWFLSTPDWIPQIPECRRWLMLFRVAVLIASLGSLGVAFVLSR